MHSDFLFDLQYFAEGEGAAPNGGEGADAGVNAADAAIRSSYYTYYISAAKSKGIKCFVWDNGKMSGESSFGIFNRGALTWEGNVLSAIMEGTK